MALLQAKGRLESAFNGWLSSGVATVANGTASHHIRLGARRNMVAGLDDNKASIPNGHLAGSAWFLPQKPGGMSSVNEAVIRFAEAGNAAQGYNRTAAAVVTFAANGNGAAVAAAIGSTTFTFAGLGSAVAPLNSSGSAAIVFASAANTGGVADITGIDNVSFSAAAATGALGWMTAVPIVQEVTAESIAEAVWSALSVSNNAAGSMGEKLNDAGSASNPWTEAIEGSVTAAELLRLISAALAGKISGAGTATVTIRDVNDTEDRIVATVDTNGNRTAVITSV